MNFLGLGPGELFLIMVLALIVFGPQKLPEIGRGLGKAIGEFRRATNEISQEFNRELQLDSILNPPVESPAGPPQKDRSEPKPEDVTSTPVVAVEQPSTSSSRSESMSPKVVAGAESDKAAASEQEGKVVPAPTEDLT